MKGFASQRLASRWHHRSTALLRRPSWLAGWHRCGGAPGLALGLGALLTVGWFFIIQSWERESVRNAMQNAALERVELLRGRLLGSLEVLDSVAALYGTDESDVSRAGFRAFVGAALKRHPEIQALSWNPFVPAAQRARYESAARADGLGGFSFRELDARGTLAPAAERAEYVPVYFEEPAAGNELSFGFDLFSSPERKATLERARDTGEPAATVPLRLVQERGNQLGFLILHPVYHGPSGSLAERRKNLAGFASAVFRVGDLVEMALGKLDARSVDLTIHDAASGNLLIHAGSAAPASRYTPLARTLDFSGGSWRLAFQPTPYFVAVHSHPWLRWTGAAACGIITLLAAGYLFQGKQHAAELALANAALRVEVVERQRAERAAAAASAAKSDFLAHMSHEIRTPLNAILGYAQILRRDAALRAEHRPAVESIALSGNHLLELINDVLDLAKIEAGCMELRLGFFNPRALVGRLETMFAQQCHAKGLTLKVDVSPSLPELVQGDEGKLRQVLINLLGNAVKFTAAGEIRLCAFASQVSAAETQTRAYFEVIDTGTGISPENLTTIFEPFQQADGGRRAGGTGLGLTISRRQIELMGGQLGVESVLGVGTRFFFDVPLAAAERESTEMRLLEPIDSVEVTPYAALLFVELTAISEATEPEEESPPLPEELIVRLRGAAELYSLTELRGCIQEISRHPAGARLSQLLQRWLDTCDIDAILRHLDNAAAAPLSPIS